MVRSWWMQSSHISIHFWHDHLWSCCSFNKPYAMPWVILLMQLKLRSIIWGENKLMRFSMWGPEGYFRNLTLLELGWLNVESPRGSTIDLESCLINQRPLVQISSSVLPSPWGQNWLVKRKKCLSYALFNFWRVGLHVFR